MSDQLIDIDVRLLVLRYGRQKVFAALARLVETTPEQIDAQIVVLSRKSAGHGEPREKRSLVEVAAAMPVDNDGIRELLRTLAIAYENRSFLPNLRDVQRFLDRVGASSQKLKSRSVAGPAVIRALSKFPIEELNKLALRESPGESDYSLLSRAIMGGPPSHGKTDN